MMFEIDRITTKKGHTLGWRHQPLIADNPLDAWQGLLNSRGLHEQDDFFSPSLTNFPNPFDMKDMDKAATRLVKAIQNKEKVHVFGDFDCDGVSGTSILVDALRSTGIEVSYSIPHRADDGHGIGVEAVREAAQAGVHLGLSVDTGTTCLDACDEANKLEFDLIVTDHHLPDEVLPTAFALLNPARKDCGFADGVLCGTGVAFFLLMAIWKKMSDKGNRPSFDLKQLLDRVAMATVADVMKLQGVNRVLVSYGLKQLRTKPSVGMSALLDSAKINRSRISVETIGFYLAPRINAAGRLAHGEEAMALLCCTKADEANELANGLDDLNIERRKIETDTFKQACRRLGNIEGNTPLVLYDESWHAGVVGLVAGRLARQHGRPAAVGFIEGSGEIRVSLRGVRGFHIGNLLHACSEHLTGFGGHAGAGGGSIKKGAWPEFVNQFQKQVELQSQNTSLQPSMLIDGVLNIEATHFGLASRLKKFEPIGQGNPACVWILRDVTVTDIQKLRGGVCRLTLSDGQRFLQGVLFKGALLLEGLVVGECVSLIGQLKMDDFRGGQAIQFIVDDIVEA